MNPKNIVLSILLLFATILVSHAQVNQTDQKGMRQGPWVKNYPHGTRMYEGIFKDGHPVGDFRRYYENGILKSKLDFTEDGISANAVLYHQNGRIASEGTYINQKKEGSWKFYSPDREKYLIAQQEFKEDKRNGQSIGFYPDSTVGDRTMYQNDLKHGDWEQFYENGAPYIKSYYKWGRLNGPYEAWFKNGKKMYSGFYLNDFRDGSWIIYNEDGSVRYKVNYTLGVPDNKKIDIDASNYINNLEKQKGKIPDPQVTGELW
jgi:antitoxin component YwqK of YwqJK toxin-antitoxin module